MDSVLHEPERRREPQSGAEGRALLVYANGALVPENEAKVSIFDRCFLYGDGVFEGIAVWRRHPFRLRQHLRRMAEGLAYLRIANPLSKSQWAEAISDLIRANDMEDGYLRIQISRGEGMSSIKWEPRLLRKPEPNVFIIPVPGFRTYYGALFKRRAEDGYRARIVSRPRIPSRSIPGNIKHCNYLNSVLGAIEVTAAGVDVGIATDVDGYVTEGIAYNVFIVKDGRLLTAPTNRDILPGITRQAVIELARGSGHEVLETDFDVFTLATAEEVFICSTLELAISVVEVDGRPIGDGRPGPVARKISELLLHEMDREASEAAANGN
jgi:branched-chain amino acid aminotransferase